VELYFSGLKHQIMSVFERTGLVAALGRERFFASKEEALRTLLERYEGSGAH
jgi:hypothetical protein